MSVHAGAVCAWLSALVRVVSTALERATALSLAVSPLLPAPPREIPIRDASGSDGSLVSVSAPLLAASDASPAVVPPCADPVPCVVPVAPVRRAADLRGLSPALLARVRKREAAAAEVAACVDLGASSPHASDLSVRGATLPRAKQPRIAALPARLPPR